MNKFIIKNVWIEAENWPSDTWNPEDDNTDVIVTIDNNQKFVASFFTYKNIQSLAHKNKQTGECLNGKYFWASDMVLIDKCSRERIEEVIEHLLKEDEFEMTFSKIKYEK